MAIGYEGGEFGRFGDPEPEGDGHVEGLLRDGLYRFCQGRGVGGSRVSSARFSSPCCCSWLIEESKNCVKVFRSAQE